ARNAWPARRANRVAKGEWLAVPRAGAVRRRARGGVFRPVSRRQPGRGPVQIRRRAQDTVPAGGGRERGGKILAGARWLGAAADDRATFAKLLRALVASERLWVVTTLRAALYEPFLAETDLKALKDAGADYDLAPPGPAELADIVRKPAEAAALVYEHDESGE